VRKASVDALSAPTYPTDANFPSPKHGKRQTIYQYVQHGFPFHTVELSLTIGINVYVANLMPTESQGSKFSLHRDLGGSRGTIRNWPLTLTTHAVVGAAIAGLTPKYPMLGICLAFASHFLLDAIPHWDYPLRSSSLRPQIAAPMKYDRALIADMLTIGSDAALGIALVLILFTKQHSYSLLFCGACAGILPDGLQFAYMRFPHKPLVYIQQFHEWIHSPYEMHNRPMLGICSQLVFLVVFLTVSRAALQS